MSDPKPHERILDFDTALAVVIEQAKRLRSSGTEELSLQNATGRVLAERICSDRDQPPFNRSTRDGYAVRSMELTLGDWLVIAGQIRAGQQWGQALLEGHAVEIMTGAPVPRDADAVVMLEHVERDGNKIRLAAGRTLAAGENIVVRGSEAGEGDVVLEAGTILEPAAIALAASCGAAKVKVYSRPIAAIVATGDELVDITETPGPSQIRNSNSYGLAALLRDAGATPQVLPTAKDTRDALEAAIGDSRTADLLILSGGVSMGEYDLVEGVLLSMGAEFYFTGVKMQPGKPVVFGYLPTDNGMKALPFFGLPGNPVSTQVTFACFVEPLLRALCGTTADTPRFVQAALSHDVKGRPGLTRVLPARLIASRTQPMVELVTWQGSGDMAASARANCYAVLSDGVEQFHQGEIVTILLK